MDLGGIFYKIDDAPTIEFEPWESPRVPICRPDYMYMKNYQDGNLSDGVVCSTGEKYMFYEEVGPDEAPFYAPDIPQINLSGLFQKRA